MSPKQLGGPSPGEEQEGSTGSKGRYHTGNMPTALTDGGVC